MSRGRHCVFFGLALTTAVVCEGAGSRSFDVLVYGATPAGVVAAVAAAREGAQRVALLEPRHHLGGMMAAGLGATDYGRQETIGGYAREVFDRISAKYGRPNVWRHEPHVAEQVFREFLNGAGVEVFLDARLREQDGVLKAGNTVASVCTEAGDWFDAAVFIDATYEGDLMHFAGVTWRAGRESSAEYGESMAGVGRKPKSQAFEVPIPGFGASTGVVAEASVEQLGPVGSADDKTQAYTFRLCLSKDPSNRIAFQAPEGYSRERYAVLASLLPALEEKLRRPLRWHSDLASPTALPNLKFDLNTFGPFSTDYVGGNWRFPYAGYAEREEIVRRHKEYLQGLLYFTATDYAVPEYLRADVAQYGLCSDEFTDSGHWPWQLYVRESRRMLGEYVMTQSDVTVGLEQPDSIGLGSYAIDSHVVQRYVGEDGYVQNEGSIETSIPVYEIAWRSLLPRRTEAVNLIVPVSLSASHIAYCTLRMEPVYMMAGQAAGTAAAIAVERAATVHDVDPELLRTRLREDGAIISRRPQLTFVADASSPGQRITSVSPGQTVVIVGMLMGPALAVQRDNPVAEPLGGTRVLFDGVPAPVVYSSNKLLKVIVPEFVRDRASTQLQVRYLGPSNFLTLDVESVSK